MGHPRLTDQVPRIRRHLLWLASHHHGRRNSQASLCRNRALQLWASGRGDEHGLHGEGVDFNCENAEPEPAAVSAPQLPSSSPARPKQPYGPGVQTRSLLLCHPKPLRPRSWNPEPKEPQILAGSNSLVAWCSSELSSVCATCSELRRVC